MPSETPPRLPMIDFSRRRPPATASSSAANHAWGAATTKPQLPVKLAEMQIGRSQSNGTLKLSPTGPEYKFATSDLEDLGQIGGGSFGIVRKMKHTASGRVMAVKRIQSVANAQEQKNMLMDLDVTTKSDKCPYIVRFFGAIFREGDCWICMQLMDISLDKFYKTIYTSLKERMPEDIIGKVAHATLSALTYLKTELNVIHRDVKPSNILLNVAGDIKLCDFGIAGQLVDSIAKTRDAGCQPYMAPERIGVEASGYGIQADVWSLGITLVEIATGKFPYTAWTNVFDQLHAVVEGDPPILTPGQGFSLNLVLFVQKCLIKEPSLRGTYQQLSELAFIVEARSSKVDVAAYVKKIVAAELAERTKTWVQFND